MELFAVILIKFFTSNLVISKLILLIFRLLPRGNLLLFLSPLALAVPLILENVFEAMASIIFPTLFVVFLHNKTR